MFFGLYSILTLALTFCHRLLIEKVDDENNLPKKFRPLFIIFILFSGGFNLCFNNSFLMMFFYSFLLIDAYTDYYVMQLYLIFSIMTLCVGYLYMFINSYSYITHDVIKDIFIFILIIVFSKFIQAINTGDVWLLIASVPYILYVCNFKDCLFVLIGVYVLALVLGLVIYIKEILYTNKQYIPFAVPYCLGYCCLIIFRFIERSGFFVYI